MRAHFKRGMRWMAAQNHDNRPTNRMQGTPPQQRTCVGWINRRDIERIEQHAWVGACVRDKRCRRQGWCQTGWSTLSLSHLCSAARRCDVPQRKRRRCPDPCVIERRRRERQSTTVHALPDPHPYGGGRQGQEGLPVDHACTQSLTGRRRRRGGPRRTAAEPTTPGRHWMPPASSAGSPFCGRGMKCMRFGSEGRAIWPSAGSFGQ